jgi:D-erythrulose 4-kinase
VLWGSALGAFGRVLGDEEYPSAHRLADAVEAFRQRLAALGKAEPGDKTMVDAVVPFMVTFRDAVDGGRPVADAVSAAAKAADTAARNTADLRPKLGRARPLAERSVGTPDPGATSFALIARVLTGETE